jgi:hypothetical protein
MLVTLAGHDILIGRALLRPTTADDYANFILACLVHDIGYVRGIVQGDEDDCFVADVNGRTVRLSYMSRLNSMPSAITTNVGPMSLARNNERSMVRLHRASCSSGRHAITGRGICGRSVAFFQGQAVRSEGAVK